MARARVRQQPVNADSEDVGEQMDKDITDDNTAGENTDTGSDITVQVQAKGGGWTEAQA